MSLTLKHCTELELFALAYALPLFAISGTPSDWYSQLVQNIVSLGLRLIFLYMDTRHIVHAHSNPSLRIGQGSNNSGSQPATVDDLITRAEAFLDAQDCIAIDATLVDVQRFKHLKSDSSTSRAIQAPQERRGAARV